MPALLTVSFIACETFSLVQAVKDDKKDKEKDGRSEIKGEEPHDTEHLDE